IAGFAIKIGKKESNDSVIRDVIIYEQGNPVQDNFIVAQSGTMRVTPDKRFLEFNLKNGWRYQEKAENSDVTKTEFIRLHFKEFKKQFDLSSFQFNRTDDSVNKNNEKMRNMRQLSIVIDSLEKEKKELKKQIEQSMVNPLPFLKYLDSTGWSKEGVTNAPLKIKSLDEVIADSAKLQVSQRAAGPIATLRVSVESISAVMKEKNENLKRHWIEWHRKLSLAFACVVLFLIGAPLGCIIRKGGLGTPLVFAIIFFILFYFSFTTGEKFVKQDRLSPLAGMWLPAITLLPVGLFLTYKAMRDSHMLNKEFYFRLARVLGSLLRGWRP
ncbi:MAG TPA: LptF/LptG family permease, partial [Chitinophagaceae bacterium]|nr:LptF/LptG family permease [Chitinophagaceae bacterium]